jgi:hypothetical protein
LTAELVNRGFATLTAEKVRAGGKLIAVAKAVGIGRASVYRVLEAGGLIVPG